VVAFVVASFGDFTIKDYTQKHIFNVQGSWPRHFYMRDNTGLTLMDIRQRSLIAFQPSYDIYDPVTGQVMMTITHVFHFGVMKFTIEGWIEPLTIRGSFFDFDFTIVRNRDGAVMARVSRILFQWTDHYAIEISLQENIALMLAAVVVIDHEIQKQRNNR